MTKLGARKQWIAVMAALHATPRPGFGGTPRGLIQNIENNPMQSRIGSRLAASRRLRPGTSWAIGTAQPDLILR
jgi:hypothetical protein